MIALLGFLLTNEISFSSLQWGIRVATKDSHTLVWTSPQEIEIGAGKWFRKQKESKIHAQCDKG